VTPPLAGTILAGVTRDSVLVLLRDAGIAVEERAITLAEIEAAHARGSLAEIFGTGTGGLIAPVGSLGLGSRLINVGTGEEGEVTRRLYAELRAIQYGQAADRYGWIAEVRAPSLAG